jgi:hypothetical protein
MTTTRFPERCPACGAADLLPVYAGETVNALCRLCLTCWEERDGLVTRTDPGPCPGCQYANICAEHQMLMARAAC